MKSDWLESKSLAAAAVRFSHPLSVRFQDVDAAKVVFFARLFDYFHDAYVAFLDEGGLPLHGVLARGEWGAPLRHAEADFLAPIHFGDLLDVGIVGAALGEGRYTLGYRLSVVKSARTKVGTVVAVGHTHHVVIGGDLDRPRRLALPEDLLKVLGPLVLDSP